ncbi:hypothetical protein A9G29_06260 [Gilliamella sp. Fer2-1]|nr:hypothetical protein A9G29_06260 [Gilliamella apicola]
MAKHSKTIADLEFAMLNTEKSKKAFEAAEYEWRLKERVPCTHRDKLVKNQVHLQEKVCSPCK